MFAESGAAHSDAEMLARRRRCRSCSWSSTGRGGSPATSAGWPSCAIVTTYWGIVMVRPGEAQRNGRWAMRWAALACWTSPSFHLAFRTGCRLPWCQIMASHTGISSPPRVIDEVGEIRVPRAPSREGLVVPAHPLIELPADAAVSPLTMRNRASSREVRSLVILIWLSTQGGSIGRPAGSSWKDLDHRRTASASVSPTFEWATKPMVNALKTAWCHLACAFIHAASASRSPSRRRRMSAAARTPVLRVLASSNPWRS